MDYGTLVSDCIVFGRLNREKKCKWHFIVGGSNAIKGKRIELIDGCCIVPFPVESLAKMGTVELAHLQGRIKTRSK